MNYLKLLEITSAILISNHLNEPPTYVFIKSFYKKFLLKSLKITQITLKILFLNIFCKNNFFSKF